MTDENRRRLTALVAATTKLDTAARLVKEATMLIRLTPKERVIDEDPDHLRGNP